MKLSIPEKLYVGFRAGTPGPNTEEFPLAFATPWGVDAAARKRIETVNNWSRPYYSKEKAEPVHVVLDNIWQSGYKVTGIESRHETSNKVFTISDPRGFSLEIYANSMESILANCTITKGTIKEKCTWARDGAKMYLLADGSPEHSEIVNTVVKVETSKPEVGDIVTSSTDRRVYLGDYYAVNVDFDYKGYAYGQSPAQRYEMKVSSDTSKKWKVLGLVTDDDKRYEKRFEVRREFGKNSYSEGRFEDLFERRSEELKTVFGEPIVNGYYFIEPIKEYDLLAVEHTIIFETKEDFDLWFKRNRDENWETYRNRWLEAHNDNPRVPRYSLDPPK